ncbi:Non-ribosomal peptide synthase [Raphidiopsis brookii D9]|nr:Non-ribosomal peptide synthase [Raphidiopsis brookii D9]
MNASEILALLTKQGVEFWIENQQLNIRSPKGIITPEMQAEIATHKGDILALLQEMDISSNSTTENPISGISLQTIGKLIGGFTSELPIEYQPPIINPHIMAKNLSVTFRPLPNGYDNHRITKFRQDLAIKLKTLGVAVVPWQDSIRDFCYKINIPIINWHYSFTIKGVRSEINAVIDVARPNSWFRKLGIFVAESIYTLSYHWLINKQNMSVVQIAKLSSWAEDHAAKYVEDPTNTQVIILSDIDDKFVSPLTHYQEKISIGINTLIQTFSEIVIGVSKEQISILNMNLSDSIFPRTEIDDFILKSLIPKIYVPITPLLMNRFELGVYNPYLSPYAHKLAKLGKELTSTGLFPPGFKLTEVIKRKSHRDIVNVIVNGRTGVSYGFIAYIEPPSYVGEREISATQWEDLLAIPGLNSDEVRKNQSGRRFLKTRIGADYIFKQIPDIWLVSSRSGSNKTDLSLEQDVLRIGLTNNLHLQLPPANNSHKSDIKPSYDIYVMLAISLSAALYAPELIENGAPIVHFHGYPAFDWFQEDEYCFGVDNPSVPCGTYESGVFNFLGLANFSVQPTKHIKLVSLIEPDHGTNLIARDTEYLIDRLKHGCIADKIELGGQHFASLRTNLTKSVQ